MNGSLHTVEGRPVLRFERRLAHPPDKVWRAITEPGHLSQWFPADIEGDRAPGAKLRFVFRDGEGPTMDGRITVFDPPRVLAYTWGDAQLHWELRPDGDGCLLIFTHTFDDRPSAASFAAGWHGCLDALELLLDGKPVEVANRWAELHEDYVERFGLGEGAVEQTADGWTLRFERQLTQPVDKVWATMTGGAEAEAAGPPPLQVTNEYVAAGVVTAAEPPRLLEHTWLSEGREVGRVRWELADGPGGARLVLTQTVPADLADQRPTALAAWHTHIELLASELRGQTVCPWPKQRTEELREHYAGLLHRG